MLLNVFAKAILGEQVQGMLEFYRQPELRESWGGPFNGQEVRRAIFLELMRTIRFDAIAETGTYRGTTTAYLREHSGLPVYTVELDPRLYGYVKSRFIFRRKISLAHDDSRCFLRRLFDDPACREKRLFFYLDAHWGEDLPLRDEMQIIFENSREPVVMIDDFAVPGDAGYQYDDYGHGKVLDLDYLRQVRETFKLAAFFPSAASHQETGAKRGCVVLAGARDTIGALNSMKTLKAHSKAHNSSQHEKEEALREARQKRRV